MKNLLIALAFVMPMTTALAQDAPATETAPEKAIPDNWKDTYDSLTRDQRGALHTSPDVDQEELRGFLATQRVTTPGLRAYGGGEFGCEAWFQHNAIESTKIFPDDWQQFDGGCGAGGAVDSYFGPIPFGFDFCFFGTSYDEFYINTKGTITFGAPMCDWTPEPFPAAGYDVIAGFWCDIDMTGAGYVEYEVTDDAVVVTFIEVGYYANNTDKVNTFQMIFTDGNSDVLSPGKNVGLLYQDMQFAHGDVGGGGGFDGPTPANVGVDDSGTTNGFSLGRFNLDNNDYDGPDGGDDGVHWLDYRSFIFSICDDPTDPTSPPPGNFAPISSNQLGGINGVLPTVANCDSIFICTNENAFFDVTYMAPETDQILTVTVDDPDGILIDLDANGSDWVDVTATIFGDPGLQGDHTITITATDNGTPAETLTQTFIVSILELEAPVMEILGDTVFCSVDGTLLTADPPGLDFYDWSFGPCDGSIDCMVAFEGTVTVEGFLGPCSNTASIYIDPSAYFIPFITPNDTAICGNECVVISSQLEWEAYDWEVWDSAANPFNTAEFCDGDSTGNSVTLGPGTYRLVATDEAGCQGANIFTIEDKTYTVTPPDTLFCNELTPLQLEGTGAPENGNLTLYLSTTNPDGWGEDFLNITVTSVFGDVYNYNGIQMPDGLFFDTESWVIQTGDQIEIEYVCGPDGSNEFNSIWIFNCDTDPDIAYKVCGPQAECIDGSEPDLILDCGIIFDQVSGCVNPPIDGTWSQDSCEEDGDFTNTDQFNTQFTPPGYGYYELIFTDEQCGIDRSFFVEYNEPPVVALDQDDSIVLCGGETVQIGAGLDAGTECIVSYEWSATENAGSTSAPDYDVSTDGTFITVGNENNYENWEFDVTATNGCGTSSDAVDVEILQAPEPELEDHTICGGTELTLDPTADDGGLTFEWTCAGCDDFVNGTSTSEIDIQETGVYTVTVSNACFDEAAVSNIEFSPGWEGTWLTTLLECEEDETTECTNEAGSNIPEEWTFEWIFNGTSLGSDDCVTLDENGVLELLVYDTTCDIQYGDTIDVFIGDPPSQIISPNPLSGDTIIVCPNEVETFDVGIIYAGGPIWTLTGCGLNENLGNSQTIQFTSDMIEDDCLDQVLTLEMNFFNSCGSQSAQWPIQASLCDLFIPNVFTPGVDLYNNRFIIPGIEKFDRGSLMVFNRWGNLVYENDAYDNSWTGDELPAGTYYFVMQLFDSTDEVLQEVADYVTIFRQD